MLLHIADTAGFGVNDWPPLSGGAEHRRQGQIRHRKHEEREEEHGLPIVSQRALFQQDHQQCQTRHGEISGHAGGGDKNRGSLPGVRMEQQGQGAGRSRHGQNSQDGQQGQVQRGVQRSPASLDAKDAQGVPEIQPEALHPSNHPAVPLTQGQGKGGRLFIIKNSVGDRNNLVSGENLLDGKFSILHQRAGIPARGLNGAHLEGKAGAADLTGEPPIAAGTVEKTHQTNPIAAADPGIPGILAVAIALDDVGAGAEGVVGLGEKIRGHQIIGVENRHRVVAPGIILPQPLKGPMQGKALADLAFVEPLKHPGPMPPGHLGGVVGAIVRHDEDIVAFPWILLPPETVQKSVNDRLFVAGTGDHGKTMELIFQFPRLFGAKQAHSADAHVPDDQWQGRHHTHNGNHADER